MTKNDKWLLLGIFCIFELAILLGVLIWRPGVPDKIDVQIQPSLGAGAPLAQLGSPCCENIIESSGECSFMGGSCANPAPEPQLWALLMYAPTVGLNGEEHLQVTSIAPTRDEAQCQEYKRQLQQGLPEEAKSLVDCMDIRKLGQ